MPIVKKNQTKLVINVNKRAMLKAVGVIFLMLCATFGGFTLGVNMTYPIAHKKGYEASLSNLSEILSQQGIDIDWEEISDGEYRISIYSNGKFVIALEHSFHLLVQQYRPYVNLNYNQSIEADSVPYNEHYWIYYKDINGDLVNDFPNEYSFLISESYHAMTTVNQGLDWVEGQLFSTTVDNCLYLSCSNDSSAVGAAWVIIPNELDEDGLARATGAYTSTGTGTANVTYTFSVTGTNATKLYGINYQSSGNTLVAAEQQGVGNQKNVNNGDTLKLTVQWSLADA